MRRILAFLLASAACWAQSNFGAAVLNAKITIKTAETNRTVEAKMGNDGSYVVPSLPPVF